MARRIEFINTKETLQGNKLQTVKVDGILLHSMYYPFKEAEEFIKAIDNKGTKRLLVYGLGVGYHIYSLLKNNVNLEIKVFDLSFDLYETLPSKSDYILQYLRNHNNVEIISDSMEREFISKFKDALGWCDNFIIYKPALKVVPKEYESFKEVLLEYQAQKVTEKKNLELMEFNCNRNEALTDAYSMNEFFTKSNLQGKNVVIVSAGPSLDMVMETLKKIQKSKDVFIISVGTPFRTLINNGIKPDALCVLDPLIHVYNQVKGLEDIGVPLCFLCTANHEAALNYRGPKYIYYNTKKDVEPVISCGNSVATAALSIAIKGKPKRIIFVGQDLAYINNKRHVNNTVYGKEHYHTINVGDFLEDGVNGEKLYTNKFFNDTKKWIERIIASNFEIQYINCSKGLNIKGCKNINIEDVEEVLSNG